MNTLTCIINKMLISYCSYRKCVSTLTNDHVKLSADKVSCIKLLLVTTTCLFSCEVIWRVATHKWKSADEIVFSRPLQAFQQMPFVAVKAFQRAQCLLSIMCFLPHFASFHHLISIYMVHTKISGNENLTIAVAKVERSRHESEDLFNFSQV